MKSQRPLATPLSSHTARVPAGGGKLIMSQSPTGRHEVTRARAGRHPGRYGCRPCVWVRFNKSEVRLPPGQAQCLAACGRQICITWMRAYGGGEPDVPRYWDISVQIAKNWEREQQQARTPRTRKVPLRSAMVMSPDCAGVFDYLLWLARLSLGGPVAGGTQYASWIHDHDFVRAVQFLIDQDSIIGPVNLVAPAPLPQRAFMNALRKAWGAPVGLPATKWMAEIGAFVLRSDTELLLKSRRVVPGRLLEAGFAINYAEWPQAAGELVRRVRQERSHS